MLMKTHVMGGVAAGLGMAVLTPQDPILVTAAAAGGALIPDICHTGSTIGKKLPLLSKVISLIFGHRTFTHSLAFLCLAAWTVYGWLPIHESIADGIIAGMASHLLLDALTKNGIKLFWPLPAKIRAPITVRTGGAAEQIYFLAFTALALYWGTLAFMG